MRFDRDEYPAFSRLLELLKRRRDDLDVVGDDVEPPGPELDIHEYLQLEFAVRHDR